MPPETADAILFHGRHVDPTYALWPSARTRYCRETNSKHKKSTYGQKVSGKIPNTFFMDSCGHNYRSPKNIFEIIFYSEKNLGLDMQTPRV